MQGKIIKGIAGFYYIHANGEIYECKAKGSFRNQKVKPLVGDNVEITVLDEDKQIVNDYDYLLDLADEKRKEIAENYKLVGANIRPLVLVQFPAGQPETIKAKPTETV